MPRTLSLTYALPRKKKSKGVRTPNLTSLVLGVRAFLLFVGSVYSITHHENRDTPAAAVIGQLPSVGNLLLFFNTTPQQMCVRR